MTILLNNFSCESKAGTLPYCSQPNLPWFDSLNSRGSWAIQLCLKYNIEAYFVMEVNTPDGNNPRTVCTLSLQSCDPESAGPALPSCVCTPPVCGLTWSIRLSRLNMALRPGRSVGGTDQGGRNDLGYPIPNNDLLSFNSFTQFQYLLKS